MTADELKVLITAQTTDFNSKITQVNNRINDMTQYAQKSTAKISGMFGKIGKAAAVAFAGKAIFDAGKQAVSYASDLQEVQNVVDTAFGDMAYKAEEFAATAIEQFGMSEVTAKKASSTYMAMSKGMGIADQSASDMAISVAKLTGDVASFYNISQDLASVKLKAIWTGETEGLKDLGVVMTQANLQQYAYRIGINKTIDTMTQAELVTLRYKYVMDQLSLAQGDFAKTSGSWANQVRQLQENWKSLMGTIGQSLIEVLTPALQWINGLLQGLSKAVQAVSGFVRGLFGIEPASSGVSKTINQTHDLSTGFDDVTASVGKTKKEMSSLAGFDQITTIGSKPEEADTSGSISFPELPDVSGDFSSGAKEIKKVSDKMVQDFENMGKKVRKVFDDAMKIIKKFSPAIKGVGTAIATAFAFKWVASAVSKFKKLPSSMLDLLLKSKAVQKAMINFNDTFEQTGKIFPSLKNGLKGFRDGLSTMQKAVIGVGGSLAVFTTVKSSIQGLTDGSKSLGDAMLNIIPIVGAAGAAMYAAFGPAGLAVAAVAGITGAIWGFYDAQKQLQQDFIEADFFDGVGISLDTFNTYLQDSQRESSAMRQSIIELSEELENNKQKISESIGTLERYQGIINASDQLTSDEVEQMKGAWDSLIESMEENLQINTDIIFRAFNESAKKAAEDLGYSVEDMTLTLQGFQRTFSTEIQRVDKEMQGFIDRMNAGEIFSEEDQQELSRLIEYSGELSTGVSETSVKLREQTNDISKIDFENTDAALQDLDAIKETGLQLIQELDDSNIASLTAIEELRKQADVMLEAGTMSQTAYNEYVKVFDEISAAISDGYERDKAEIEKSLAATTGAISLQLKTQMQETIDNTVPTPQQIYLSTMGKLDLKKDISDQVNKQIGDPINNKLAEMAKEWEVTADEKLGAELMKGLSSGITDNTSLATDAIGDAAKAMESEFRSKTDTHSPSRVYAELGEELMNGLSKGISAGQNGAVEALKKALNAMTDRINQFMSRTLDGWRDMFKQMSRATGSMSFNASVQNVGTPRIPKLASGGIVSAPTIAVVGEYAGARSNPEVIAPLDRLEAMLTQSNGGNQSGVIAALFEICDRLERAIEDGKVIELDGVKVGESTTPYVQKEMRRIGNQVIVY